MVFTNKRAAVISAVTLFLLTNVAAANAYSGLATQDQNPLLIPYWIPHTIASSKQNELQVSSSLFITNTLHDETVSNETLIIDVETYRFDLNFQYQYLNWTYHLQVPLIASNSGFMDSTIVDWHGFFGLPQGQRLAHPTDVINIQYQNGNDSLINTQQSYNGVGDISIVAIHPFYQSHDSDWYFGLGLNVPTGDKNLLISNNKIDSSLWFSYFSHKKPFFLTAGIIKAGNGGVFKNQLNSLVTFSQAGLQFDVSYFEQTKIQLQLDYHSAFIEGDTKAFGESLQMQFALNIAQSSSSNIVLFFSEDILVESAPDITFGIQVNWSVD